MQQKTCSVQFTHNNVAAVDYEKCKNCGMCMGVCPINQQRYNERHAKMKINAKKKAVAEKAAKAAEAKAKAAAQA